jgi:hypothetical protein
MGMQNGPGDWLGPWLLTSLQGLERRLGELTGALRASQSAAQRDMDDFRRETTARLMRLEQHMHSLLSPAPRRQLPEPLEIALQVARRLPWTHIAGLAALAALGLMGHLGPDDLRRWLMGLAGLARATD